MNRQTPQTLTTDIAIIGAGPVGLFAAFECGMLKMRPLLIDALDAPGGQCTALYPEKPIYDIPAHPAIDAAPWSPNSNSKSPPSPSPACSHAASKPSPACQATSP
jgi:cation diffusion facilitator CzcD-associated flavoprotein CzcO